MDFSKIDRARFLEASLIVEYIRASKEWDERKGPEIVEVPAAALARMPVKEACKYLGVGETRFRQLVKAGEIPQARYWNGNRPLWDKEDLDKYLASKRKGK